MEKNEFWELVDAHGEYSPEALRVSSGSNRRKSAKTINGPRVVTELRALGYRATFHVTPDQPTWGRVITDAPVRKLDLAFARAKAPGRYLTAAEAAAAREAIYAACSELTSETQAALQSVTPCPRCGGFGGAIEEDDSLFGACHQRDPINMFSIRRDRFRDDY